MLDVTRAYGLSFLFPAQDTAVGKSLREAGEFARPEVDLIAQLAKGTFADVGANIGAISLPVAAQRPELRVVAAEAHRGLFGLLAANTYSNHLMNVEPHHVAVGREVGVVDFPTQPLGQLANFGEGSLAVRGSAPLEPVRSTTLDALAPDDVGFVKIDVEGAEPAVLAGATHTLTARRPAWLVEVHRDRPQVTREVVDTFRATGYRLFWFFSPFTTTRRTKPKFYGNRVLGDYAVLALDGPAPIDTPEFTDEPPRSITDFPYLRAYMPHMRGEGGS